MAINIDNFKKTKRQGGGGGIPENLITYYKAGWILRYMPINIDTNRANGLTTVLNFIVSDQSGTELNLNQGGTNNNYIIVRKTYIKFQKGGSAVYLDSINTVGHDIKIKFKPNGNTEYYFDDELKHTLTPDDITYGGDFTGATSQNSLYFDFVKIYSE